MTAPARRASIAVLLASAALTTLVACGGTSGTESGAAPRDGRALVRAAYAKVWAKEKSPASLDMTVTSTLKGSGGLDEDLRAIDGSFTMRMLAYIKKPNATTLSADSLRGSSLRLTAGVKGSYTDGDGKQHSGDYDGSLSWVNDQLFLGWDGDDYAVGEALSQEVLKKLAESSSATQTPTDGAAVAKAIALAPESWLKDVKVSNGPNVGGDETWSISGPIDFTTTVRDWVDGVRGMYSAFPQLDVEGRGDTIRALTYPTSEQLRKVEETTDKAQLDYFVFKRTRGIAGVHMQWTGHDPKDSSSRVDFSLDVRGSRNATEKITAPTKTSPFTDLIFKLQEQFPTLGDSMRQA